MRAIAPELCNCKHGSEGEDTALANSVAENPGKLRGIYLSAQDPSTRTGSKLKMKDRVASAAATAVLSPPLVSFDHKRCFLSHPFRVFSLIAFGSLSNVHYLRVYSYCYWLIADNASTDRYSFVAISAF